MKRSKINILSIICTGLLLFSFTILFYSCSCGCGVNSSSDVPLNILIKSNDFIISKTGNIFFEKYITAEFAQIKYEPPYYKMVYRFFMPEKPFVDGLIKFSVDSLGNVDNSHEISGIPDFKNNPESCSFFIDERNAIRLAKNFGLEKGIIDWKIGILWDSTLNRYVWHILSTFSQSGDTSNYKGNGKELIIDPGNGKILAVNFWHIP
jgi:hypothetical protein